MAKTLRQRQADWRGRRDMKSALFDILNAERIRKLREQNFPTDRPEARALADFFLAYPRCQNWPAYINLAQGEWVAIMRREGDEFEAAAALVALSEVTSLPIRISIPAEPYTFDNPEIAELVRKEVAELRRLNLWGVA